ncbi:MAG: chitobiase/beta-hexosaminidase C-terminal domain-containing protein, partial [Bacteroidota bacterium]
DGWQRWTWRINPHWDAAYPNLTMLWSLHEYGPGFDGNVNFEIADVALVELPEVPLQPFAPGEGVSFPGGPGDLEMAVEGVETEGDILRVRTTGALFELDAAQGTLSMRQRLDFQRELARVEDLPLQGLSIQSQSPELVVLVGDSLTIGVQVDGTLVLSPHARLQTELISRIGGDFNRMEGGDLLCEDDFGGFTANIHVPKGTGRIPRLSLLTQGLPFEGLDPEDLASTGAAAPNWRAEMLLDPGERLFLSVFPSRRYDWAESFEQQWALTFEEASTDYQDPTYVTDWIIWDISERGWGMSQGPRYELRETADYLPHVLGISQAGDNWGSYFSQWFYYSRDAEEWANELKRWRDSLNMDVVYSDGLAQDDWLVAYEGMRRLRGDVFPNKPLIIHDSYPQSGVAAAAFRPFIYSYATSTYMGENAPASGEDWAWARYAMGQYRRSNAFGVTKGDGWVGFEGVEKYLIGLVWGGRGRAFITGYDSVYMPILTQLKTLWQSYGDDPHFFDRYYHPEAQLLTGFKIGRTGMPIFVFDSLSGGQINLALSSWTPAATIHYTLDGTIPDAGSPIYQAAIDLSNVDTLRAIALHPEYEESAVAIWTGEKVTANGSTLATGEGLRYAAPNPADQHTTIRFQLPPGSSATWYLLDGQGKSIQKGTISDAERQSGQFSLGT